MSFDPKPCAHCGAHTFHVLPSIQVELWQPTVVLGMSASQKLGRGTFTLVVCTHCGRTETFTANAAELARLVPGAHVVTSTGSR